MPSILGANTLSSGYDVANSVRLNRGDSPNLTRTPGSASDRRTWTWSGWVKRSGLGSIQTLFNGSDGSYPEIFYFAADDTFIYHHDISGSDYKLISSQVFRDTTAWYHIVVAKDTTQGTETNRLKVYVNGSQITMAESALGYPTQNFQGAINIDDVHIIGNWKTNSYYVDGYLCEVAFVDGSQLAPDQFGEFDEDSPTIWKPIDVSGLTFGTNGFYLDFEDSSDLGTDVSGNGNDYTANNLAATDQCTDTCTNNFATFNGNLKYSSTMSLVEGNLKGTTGSSHEAFFQSFFSTIGVSAGKWYAEFKVTAQAGHALIGISADMESDANGSTGSAYSFIYKGQGLGLYGANGKFFHTNSDTQVSYGSALSNNDIIGVAMDVDNQEVYFSENGTFLNSGNPASGASKTGGVVNAGGRNIFSTGSGTLFFAVADFDQSAQCVFEANFGGGSVSAISSGNADANGHGNFEYAVPSGYFALCTKNLAEHG